MTEKANMATHASPATFQLPEDLQGILDDLVKAETQSRNLVAGLDEEQFNFRPNGTAWSVAQCLDHLAKTNVIYTAALRSAVRNVTPGSVPRRSPIRPGWFARYFIKSLDAPPRRKFAAPKKVLPASYSNPGEVLAAFLSSHEQIRFLIAECRDMDLNRIRFKNPFLRIFPWTVAAGLLIMAAHDRRHLWQAQQVRSFIESRAASNSTAYA